MTLTFKIETHNIALSDDYLCRRNGTAVALYGFCTRQFALDIGDLNPSPRPSDYVLPGRTPIFRREKNRSTFVLSKSQLRF